MSFKFNAHRLEDRVAVITAGTQGIGLAIAERLGHEGAKLVVSSRKQKNVDEAVEYLVKSGLDEKKVAGITCHIGNAEDRDKLLQFALDKFHRIDILINNAGINPYYGDLMGISEEAWDKTFDLNCKAAFLLTQKVAPIMAKTGGGNIIFNASIGAYKPHPKLAVYGVTKTVLLAMTKAFAQGLAPMNIRVNCVAPGVIETRFNLGSKREETGVDRRSQKRYGQKRIAARIAYLVSDDASYVTGETHVVSGGVGARL
ncbi:Dehydrogenase/reductase SDR family member 4 [Aphelenchoides besseyi]|nr:Dehydrogenase/reductase SDR family member 4 [Aphelenchoides besseyi]